MAKDDGVTYESGFPTSAGAILSLVGGGDSICATDEDGNKGYGATEEEAFEDLERNRS
jgi:hypothetical protein